LLGVFLDFYQGKIKMLLDSYVLVLLCIWCKVE